MMRTRNQNGVELKHYIVIHSVTVLSICFVYKEIIEPSFLKQFPYSYKNYLLIGSENFLILMVTMFIQYIQVRYI